MLSLFIVKIMCKSAMLNMVVSDMSGVESETEGSLKSETHSCNPQKLCCSSHADYNFTPL